MEQDIRGGEGGGGGSWNRTLGGGALGTGH